MEDASAGQAHVEPRIVHNISISQHVPKETQLSKSAICALLLLIEQLTEFLGFVVLQLQYLELVSAVVELAKYIHVELLLQLAVSLVWDAVLYDLLNCPEENRLHDHKDQEDEDHQAADASR